MKGERIYRNIEARGRHSNDQLAQLEEDEQGAGTRPMVIKQQLRRCVGKRERERECFTLLSSQKAWLKNTITTSIRLLTAITNITRLLRKN